MEGLFFATSIIWWIEPKYWFSVLFLIFGAILFYISKKATHKSNPEKKDETREKWTFIPIDISDTNFCKKIIPQIKSYISYQYFPKQSKSHTTKEISQYCNSSILLKILEELEVSLYGDGTISQKRKQEIVSILSKYVPTNDNIF